MFFDPTLVTCNSSPSSHVTCQTCYDPHCMVFHKIIQGEIPNVFGWGEFGKLLFVSQGSQQL